jgi:hypothetical protein
MAAIAGVIWVRHPGRLSVLFTVNKSKQPAYAGLRRYDTVTGSGL